MTQVLPVIIVCCVGIVACLASLVALWVKSLPKRKGRKRTETFEFDENTLTIDLKNRKG